MSELSDKLAEVATAPILLIASDYDGTLAPIVSDPGSARPLREAIVALENLAALPQTHMAVISGRSLRDLASMTAEPAGVHLVGSHGSEFDPDFAATIPEDRARLLEELTGELERIAGDGNGFTIERKPASVAFHYRNAEKEAADRAVETVLAVPGQKGPGVQVHHGKLVIELAVVETNKGKALERLRCRLGASAAVFIGDDQTDEDAFATLHGPDVGIKVGPGPTRAAFRARDATEVAQILARLSELRCQWLAGSEAVPIERHALLTDRRTLALVTPDARITWFCAPRADSPALLADLIGGPTAGYFSVADADGAGALEQEYLGDTFILQTRFPTFTVTDYLDCSDSRPDQRAGRSDLTRVIAGSGSVVVEFCPRLDFGRVPTRLTQRDGGLEIEGTLDPIVLRAPGVRWQLSGQGPHQNARALIDLGEDPVTLVLRYGTGSLSPGVVPEKHRREQTRRYWADWAEGLNLPEIAPDLVGRSALVLRGLCHGPTGAILAAGTMSLPEHIGGVRNWDYRYCWIRDAAMAAGGLVRLGSHADAMAYLDWVLGVVDHCQSPERLQPLYTIAGAELGSEAEIGELSGYRGSRPVRVGNAASRQVQLDVFGPVVELVYELLVSGAPLSGEHWRLVEAMVQAVQRRWRDPDHGIWEIRLPPRHHVHSKVMCWVTADRAARISARFLGKDRADLEGLRDRIRDDVLEHGFSRSLNAFGVAYGIDQIDASVLEVGLRGLIEPDDPRFVSTVEAVEKNLRLGPTVYRYRYEDGLPGTEGGFHLCTAWLIDALVLIGRPERARDLFNEMIALVGPTGLLPEQYGPKTKRALGNHPQAYSHLALIDAALTLSESGGRLASRAGRG